MLHHPDPPPLPSRRRWLGLMVLTLALEACRPQETPGYAPRFSRAAVPPAGLYIFGVHPLHNPRRLFDVYAPLLDYLEQRIPGCKFRLEASRDYAEYDRKLYSRHFHFALPNPYQTLKAMAHGYRVFAKQGDDKAFRGIILVRRDSGIREVTDLRGKAVSYPAPTALAATMLPQYYLQTHGLDVNRDIENRYVGSQESSILNVYLGQTAAGATWPPPWQALSRERPELAAALEVKWQTESLPNNSLMARDDVPLALINQIRQLLITLQTNESGRSLLERMHLSHFETADDLTYQPVREFLTRFNTTVRTLE